MPTGIAPTVMDVTPRAAASTAQDFGDYMRQLSKAAGFEHPSALARAAGLSPTNVLRWMEGSASPSLDALRKIGPCVGVLPGELAIRAGLIGRDEMPSNIASPPPGPPLAPVLRSAQSRLLSPKLTTRQKRALEAHLERALMMFDEMVEEIAAAPKEPRMRTRG